MNEMILFSIVDHLLPTLYKQNTTYHKAITIKICVCCFIYKLAQGANFLTCNKLFAIRKSTISLVLHEFVDAFIYKYKFLIY